MPKLLDHTNGGSTAPRQRVDLASFKPPSTQPNRHTNAVAQRAEHRLLKMVVTFLRRRAAILLRLLKDLARVVVYYGNSRWCPVCGNSSRKFRAFGRRQLDARCIHCDAFERHRFAWLFLNRNTDLFDGKRKHMLHVAREGCFEQQFRKLLGDGYVTADLRDPTAMVKMDIAHIQYPDESFDVVFCSHVLDQVPDDKQAMRELHRVLKKDGWAILLVPITRDRTLEQSTISDPVERQRLFGGEHVRHYGPDYADRLRQAGFHVTITQVSDLFGKQEAIRMGLTPASGDIHYCTKM